MYALRLYILCKGRGETKNQAPDEGEKKMTKQQELNEQWFFDGGHEGMNKLQQVDYLVCECGWNEDSAFEMIYGNCDY